MQNSQGADRGSKISEWDAGESNGDSREIYGGIASEVPQPRQKVSLAFSCWCNTGDRIFRQVPQLKERKSWNTLAWRPCGKTKGTLSCWYHKKIKKNTIQCQISAGGKKKSVGRQNVLFFSWSQKTVQKLFMFVFHRLIIVVWSPVSNVSLSMLSEWVSEKWYKLAWSGKILYFSKMCRLLNFPILKSCFSGFSGFSKPRQKFCRDTRRQPKRGRQMSNTAALIIILPPNYAFSDYASHLFLCHYYTSM